MAFVRVKKRGNKQYYYLAENFRQDGKVKQRIVRYLGVKRPRGPQKSLRAERRH